MIWDVSGMSPICGRNHRRAHECKVFMWLASEPPWSSAPMQRSCLWCLHRSGENVSPGQWVKMPGQSITAAEVSQGIFSAYDVMSTWGLDLKCLHTKLSCSIRKSALSLFQVEAAWLFTTRCNTRSHTLCEAPCQQVEVQKTLGIQPGPSCQTHLSSTALPLVRAACRTWPLL